MSRYIDLFWGVKAVKLGALQELDEVLIHLPPKFPSEILNFFE